MLKRHNYVLLNTVKNNRGRMITVIGHYMRIFFLRKLDSLWFIKDWETILKSMTVAALSHH